MQERRISHDIGAHVYSGPVATPHGVGRVIDELPCGAGRAQVLVELDHGPLVVVWFDEVAPAA